jgi:chloramphenicol-sensitive protein RarD
MKKSIIIAVITNLLFGIMPVYWKMLSGVSNVYVLGHRMVWSILFTLMFAALGGKLYLVKKAFRNPRAMVFSLLSGITIVGNWYLYIWAVNSGMVAETSLAYYMSPLIVFLLGVLWFKETFRKWDAIAVCFAGVGIALSTISVGTFPWVAALLAVTFALYGGLKKMAGLDAAVSLTVEMTLLLPAALIYLAFSSFGVDGHLAGISWWEVLLLIGTGFVSSFPLWLYGKGVNALPLSLVGFLQFIWPTTSLIMSIFVFHETVAPAKLACFGLIWIGLVIFTCSRAFGKKNIKDEKSIAK